MRKMRGLHECDAPLPKDEMEVFSTVLSNPADYGLATCSLCPNRRAAWVGLFIPSEKYAKRIGQPNGKQRIIFYAFCGRCVENADDSRDRLERLILEEMQVQ